MLKKTVTGIILTLLLMSTLSLAFPVVLSTMDRSSRLRQEEVIGESESLAQWNKTYGGTLSDGATSLVPTSDGGYTFAGWTESFGAGGKDFWLVKTDADGNIQWNKTYGGILDECVSSIIQTVDNGYALAGWISYGVNNCDCWLVKTDADGNMQWNKTYGGTKYDLPHEVIQINDGGYMLAGRTKSFGSGQGDFWLVKTDGDGNMQWNKTYGGTLDESAECLVQTADGGYAVAGWAEEFTLVSTDLQIFKTDADGNIQWNKTYGDYYTVEGAGSLLQTDDGGYAIGGGARSDFWLVKTDANGSVQWDRTYGGSDYEIAYSVVQSSGGGYALAGYTKSFGAGNADFWLVKTDASGNIEWNKTYGGSGRDIAESVVQTVDGGYALAGWTESFGAGNHDLWLVKMVPCHDVVVVDVSPSKTVIGQGFPVFINVAVENECFFSETVNVTVYADVVAPFGDGIIIGEQTNIYLPVGETQCIQFQWDTTGLAKGNYTISAIASPVPDEIDTANNLCTAVVTIAMVGDIVPDGTIDIFDLVAVATWFGSTVPPAPSNSDIIEDKLIDIYDLVTVAIHYGETNH